VRRLTCRVGAARQRLAICSRTVGHCSSRARAFTLTEVLVAIGMAVGLMAALLWFYQHAARVRRDVTDQLQRIQTRRLVMNRLTDQLRGAMVYPFLNIGMEGDTQSITFVTAVLPGPAAWAVRQGTDDPIPPQQDLVLTQIGLRVVEDDDGYQVIEGLEARTQKLIAATNVTEDDDSETDETSASESALLSPFIHFARFRYWDGANWVETWAQATLPAAVEVAFGHEYLPEGTDPIDYPYDLATRVIYLPGSQGLSDDGGLGDLLRGLEGGLPQ